MVPVCPCLAAVPDFGNRRLFVGAEPAGGEVAEVFRLPFPDGPGGLSLICPSRSACRVPSADSSCGCAAAGLRKGRSAQRPGRCVCGAAGAVTAGRIGCGAVSRDRVWKNFARGCGLVLSSVRVGSLCRGAGCLRRGGSAAVPCGRAAEAGGVAGRIACDRTGFVRRAQGVPGGRCSGSSGQRPADCPDAGLSVRVSGRDGALRQAGFAANGIQPVPISFSLRVLPDAIATAETFLETSRPQAARVGAEDS